MICNINRIEKTSMARRKQSLQRVHEEGKRVFDELSEKLYTLEAAVVFGDKVGHPKDYCFFSMAKLVQIIYPVTKNYGL